MKEGKPRILVTDDSSMDRRLCTGLLEAEGYQVETAEDGLAALDRLKIETFDLMLLDVHMPGMTGLEVLGELRGSAGAPPVVVLTSDTTSDSVLRAIREQAFSYLAKPVTAASLLPAVEDALSSASVLPPIEVLSSTPHWVELMVPCDESIARRMPVFMAHLDADLSEEVRESVGTAFYELLRNAIEWGGEFDPDRRVRIAYLRTKRLLLYRIADPGPGFDPEAIEHAAISHPPGSTDHTAVRAEKGLRSGGYGLVMAQGTVDELVYNEAHNEVVFIKYLW